MLHEFGDNQKLDISVNGKERWIRINCCSCLNEGVLLSFIFVVIVGVGVQKCERWEVLELKIDLTSFSCLRVDIQIIETLYLNIELFYIDFLNWFYNIKSGQIWVYFFMFRILLFT